MRHVCFWQHQLLQRGWWALKKLIMEFAFNVTRLAIWAINCSCFFCITLCCMSWTFRSHRGVTAKHSKEWDGPSGFLIHRRSYQIFFRIQKSNWQTAKIDKRAFQISCFVKKLPRYYGPVRLKRDTPRSQKNNGGLSRNQGVAVIFRVLEVAYNTLPANLANITFCSLWWCRRKIVIRGRLDNKH